MSAPHFAAIGRDEMSTSAKAPIEMMLDSVTWKPVEWSEQSNDGIPYATHEGAFEMQGFQFKVYQLSNGQRLIDHDDLMRFFGGLLGAVED
jgi:hypothetical protein